MALSYEECYLLLGLDEQASWDEVREAYKRRVSHWHPDKYIDDSAEGKLANDKFVELSLAYSRLKPLYQENTPVPPKPPKDIGLQAAALYDYQHPSSQEAYQQSQKTPIRQLLKLLLGLFATGGLTVAILATLEWLSTRDTLDYMPQSKAERLLSPSETLTTPTQLPKQERAE